MVYYLHLQTLVSSPALQLSSKAVASRRTSRNANIVGHLEIPITKFTIFPSLPPEIREMIWALALPTQNLTTVSTNSQRQLASNRKQKGLNLPKISFFNIRYKIPAVFQTCFESRQIAKKNYSAAFVPQLTHLSDEGRYVWFNYQSDLLFFESFHAFKAFYHQILPTKENNFSTIPANMEEVHDNVEKVAVNGLNRGPRGEEQTVAQTVNLYKNLKFATFGGGPDIKFGYGQDIFTECILGTSKEVPVVFRESGVVIERSLALGNRPEMKFRKKKDLVKAIAKFKDNMWA